MGLTAIARSIPTGFVGFALAMHFSAGFAIASKYSLSRFDALRGVIVYDVAEDADRSIWLASEGGIWRWRSNGFEPVLSPTAVAGGELAAERWGHGAISIVCDDQRTLWIGSLKGLLAVDTVTLERYAAPEPLKSVGILHLRQLPDGTTWAGTTEGLYQVSRRGGVITATLVHETRGEAAEDVVREGDRLWVATQQALLEISPGGVKRHLEKVIHGRNVRLHWSSKKELWLGLRNEAGLYRRGGDGFERIGSAQGLIDDQVNCIEEDFNGSIWVGTENGVFRQSGDRFLKIGRTHGLDNEDVHSILFDHERMTWFGTFGGGVFLLRSPDIRNFGPSDGLSYPFVTSLLDRGDGQVVTATLRGLFTLDFEQETIRSVSDRIDVRDLCRNAKGHIWAAARNFAYCIETRERVPVPGVVQCIGVDSDDVVHVGSSQGLFGIESGLVRKIELPDSIAGQINCCYALTSGLLLVGSDRGIGIREDGRWRALPRDGAVLSIAHADDGRIWIGGINGIERMRPADGQTDLTFPNTGQVNRLLTQDERCTWAATDRGLLAIREGRARRATLEDGLPSRDLRGLALIENRYLLVGTSSGIARVDTRDFQFNDSPPLVSLDVWSRDRSLSHGAVSGFSIESGDQGLIAEVTAVGRRSTIGMEYQFRLIGPTSLDTGWTRENRLRLPQLAAGPYQLLAVGRNADGLSSNESLLSFEVMSPFWLRTSFLVSAGIGAVLLVVGGGYHFRKRADDQSRLEHNERRFRTLVESLQVIPYQVDGRSGVFRYIGPQTSTILSIPQDDWLRGIDWRKFIPEDDRPILQQLWNRAMETESHCTDEHRIVSSSGKVRWFRNIVGVHGTRDDPSLLHGLMVDISAVKHAAETEKAVRGALEGAVAERTRELTRANEALVREIEEHRRVELELERQRVFFRQVIDINPNFVFAKDTEGRFTLVNKAVAEAYGAAIDSLIGRTDADFNPNADEVAFFRKMDTEVMATLRERHIPEEVITDASGRERILQTVKLPLTNDAGDAVGILGVSTDITLRKQAEQALRVARDELEERVRLRTKSLEDTQNFLQQVLDCSPGLIFIKNVSGRTVFVNKALTAQLDIDPEQLLHEMFLSGAATNELVENGLQPNRNAVPETPVVDGDWMEIALSGKPRTEERCVHFPGREMWFQVVRVPLPRSGGPPEVLGIATDITKRKRAEQALRESEDRLHRLTDAVPAAVYRYKRTAAGTQSFEFVSRGIQELCEITAPSALEDFNRVWSQLLPEHVARIEASIEASAQSLSPWQEEYQLRTPSGRVKWIRGSSLPEAPRPDGTIYWNGLLIDITERKQLEEQLRQSQKIEAVGTLASGIAHQFDSLLTAISAYTDLAKTTLSADHRAVRALEKVETTARHARGVTNALLTFSHQAATCRTTLQLQQVLNDTLEMLSRVLSSHVRISANIPEAPPYWVVADATQIEQVLLNLAVNAQDAMPNGGRLEVTLTESSADEWSLANVGTHSPRSCAVISVSDTGAGIDSADLPRIFEPFFTTKPRGQGTGLGLSITLGIVEDLGGVIRVESMRGSGTLFRVCLPCVDPPKTVVVAEPVQDQRGRQDFVVIVENNPQVRSIITSTLRAAVSQVLPAKSLKEAIEISDNRQPWVRVILADLGSVTKEDLKGLEELRKRNPGVNLIFFADSTSQGLRLSALSDCLVLRKPFEMPELMSMVQRCLSSAGGNPGVLPGKNP